MNDSEPRAGKSDIPCLQVVARLVAVLGRNLTAFIGGVRNISEADIWSVGEGIDVDQETRLWLALRVVDILLQKEDPRVIQSWMIGLNPELGDRVPLLLLRDGPVGAIANDLVGAATVMLVHG